MKQMVMDNHFIDYCGTLERLVNDEKNMSLTSDWNFYDGPNNYFTCLDPLPPSGTVYEGDLHDFNDAVLKYINQMLIEENIEEKTCMFQDSAALQAAERSFYEVLGERYPPSPDHQESNGVDSNNRSHDEHSSCVTSCIDTCNTSNCTVIGPISNCNETKYESPPFQYADNVAIPHIQTSLVEVVKKEVNLGATAKMESICETECYSDGSREKKKSAIFAETIVRSEMFDLVLLCSGGKNQTALRQEFQNGFNKNIQQNHSTKASNSAKTRGKKQQRGKRDEVDLRTLLSLCAQAIGRDDRRSANDLLKQIRQHSSPTGDSMHRLAHYFADGLEARVFGSGTQSYAPVFTKPTSAAEVLKAYHLHLSVCPFKKISNFYANQTIMNVSENAMKLHIVDFGVLYGFQWPCLIQRLSSRPGGPPKLRITGIDLPNSGFRPAARVEETGQRLADYAKSFNVPFEFNAIAQKWETIKIEDLKLDRDEVLVVNCHHRFRNLLDETVVVSESPRNKVLNLIREMNPDAFLLGIANGSHNSPFFISRFREALFYYTSLFDMLEANVPRKVNERFLLEKQIYGWEIMNIIACEGPERIERPETYKQWQVRNVRTGFRQLPLDRDIMIKATERVSTCYHKDFVIDKYGDWMLLGWKGKIIIALSCWKAAW